MLGALGTSRIVLENRLISSSRRPWADAQNHPPGMGKQALTPLTMTYLIGGAAAAMKVVPALIMSHQINTAGESLERSTVFKISPLTSGHPQREVFCFLLVLSL